MIYSLKRFSGVSNSEVNGNSFLAIVFMYCLLLDTFQERFLHMVHYGDWLSFWCAIHHESDPSPVIKISRLKDELSEK